MLDELEQADPNLIKARRQIESVKKRINEMKWQMRKIVLLAGIVSILFQYASVLRYISISVSK